MTPLHLAALYGKLEVAMFLLERGAVIDSKDNVSSYSSSISSIRSSVILVSIS